MAIILFHAAACSKGPLADEPDIYGYWVDPADGTVYRTIQLGNQLWMADNLNLGEMIDAGKEQLDNGIIEKYCYDNNPEMCDKYGGLYQWGEAMRWDTTDSSRGICPEGWHIPSDGEWKLLEIYLGMPREAADDILWRGHFQGAMLRPDGNTGFDALLAGNRYFNGHFHQAGSTGYFWTSTSSPGGHAWRRGVNVTENGIYRSVNLKTFGFSVRCMKYQDNL